MSGAAAHLTEERVLLDLEVRTRRDLLDELAKLLGGNDENVREAVRDDLRAREQIASTAVGGGIAFPHARVDGLPALRLAFVRTARPIRYDALDERDVDLFLGLAGPLRVRRKYLALLGQLSYALRTETAREELRAVGSAREVIALLERLAPESAGRR